MKRPIIHATVAEMAFIGVFISACAFPVALFYLFNFTLMALLSQFGTPFLWLASSLLFGVGLLLAVGYAIIYWRNIRLLACLPLLFLCLLLACIQLLPLPEWSLRLEFAMKHQARQQAALQIQNQFLQETDGERLIRLPASDCFLSAGGCEVVVKKID
ncbi:MAG: hypothetical protein MUD01_20145, partial [Chloroflexaceae bacterium]|nr:hypothetical protein [Chloroflexaceae bacterium]